MSAPIMGGDRENTYKEFLSAQGLDPVVHWNGRNTSERPIQRPRGLVFVAATLARKAMR